MQVKQFPFQEMKKESAEQKLDVCIPHCAGLFLVIFMDVFLMEIT